MSSYPLSPLSNDDLPPDSSSAGQQQHQDGDSPLSTLASPQSSFETNEASYSVRYSWSGTRTSSIDERRGGREFGQEVTVITEGLDEPQHIPDDVPRELKYGLPTPKSEMYGATPKAGTVSKKYDSTPKAGSANRYDATPKAGTAAKRLDATFKAGNDTRTIKIDQDATNNKQDNRINSYDENHLATPSWDIDQTFSFRKSQKNGQQEQQHQHQPQRSQSSFSGLWDFMSAIGLSRSESMAADKEGATVQADDSNETDEEPHLTESTENDLFAMEVGLML